MKFDSFLPSKGFNVSLVKIFVSLKYYSRLESVKIKTIKERKTWKEVDSANKKYVNRLKNIFLTQVNKKNTSTRSSIK